MGLGDEHRQRYPLAVEKVPPGCEAKAHGRHTQIDEISMGSWVGQSLRGLGQSDATLAQLHCLLRSGRFEVDIDRTALLMPLASPHGGLGGTARENPQEHERQSHEATMQQQHGRLKDVEGSRSSCYRLPPASLVGSFICPNTFRPILHARSTGDRARVHGNASILPAVQGSVRSASLYLRETGRTERHTATRMQQRESNHR
jgi:hypothetical protein